MDNNNINGLKVFVYFNLHRRCWSVKALEGENRGRVVAHLDRVQLRDCVFKVSEAGRQRVLREKRKNVHAGVVGRIDQEARHWWGVYEVTYNPYRFSNFVAKRTSTPVGSAGKVIMQDKRVWVANGVLP